MPDKTKIIYENQKIPAGETKKFVISSNDFDILQSNNPVQIYAEYRVNFFVTSDPTINGVKSATITGDYDDDEYPQNAYMMF